jgi:DNA-binding HxlR family transcriptional regulator
VIAICKWWPQSTRGGCPINAAVELIGDRWSLLVLRDVVVGDYAEARHSFATRSAQ